MSTASLCLRCPQSFVVVAMESSRVPQEDEEYVMLDLDCVSGLIDLLPDTPYVLSGLDTMNPVLIIDNKLKLIGQYEETIGTCIVLTEDDSAPIVHEETGPSETNLFSGMCIIDPNQAPTMQVKPITCLHKILKFRLLADDELQDVTREPDNSNVNADV